METTAPSTLTLADFLLARIAEDEAAARAAGGEWWWPAEIPGEAMRKSADEPTKVVIDSPSTLITYEVCKPEHADHIVRHDPEGVLAECEAHRRIVRMMSNVLESFSAQNGGPGRPMWNDVNRRERHHANEVLYSLALPYVDHPDYREEWRP